MTKRVHDLLGDPVSLSDDSLMKLRKLLTEKRNWLADYDAKLSKQQEVVANELSHRLDEQLAAEEQILRQANGKPPALCEFLEVEMPVEYLKHG
tara:strand:+ start:153 stop:434 length:282 start_codon:yes stop_codon:yes gene_type:complete